MQTFMPYTQTARKLINGSDKKKYDPFNRVEYQEKLSGDHWQFPETLMSLYYSPIYQELSDEQRWRMSLLEAINFFSINIHGEQALVAAMEPRLYRDKRAGEDPVSSQYMQRFIHEENSHTYMLADYCLRYYGSIFPDRSFAVEQPKLSVEAEDILYYGRIYILETYLGFVNEKTFNNPDVDKTAHQVHLYHFTDEVRHKAWDKVMIEENFHRAKAKGLDEELRRVQVLLTTYQEYVEQSSCNPLVYRVMGFENILQLRTEAVANLRRKEMLSVWAEGLTQFFSKVGFE